MMISQEPGGDHATTEVDLVLCRATLYGALALGFRPPSQETITRLISENGVAALSDAAAALDPDHDPRLRSAARNLAVGEKASVAEMSTSYLRLFGHTARGLVPPYETEYGAGALFQQPQEMGDLTGFYLAFGLTVNPAEHERPDHVSCECEFLFFLALKEAYGLESGDIPMLEEVRKATRLFLRDHLGRFVPAFARKLVTEGRGGFYGNLGELCLRFVTAECARLGVALGAQNLSLRPATDDRVPMACGSGTECAAMPGVCDPEENGSV